MGTACPLPHTFSPGKSLRVFTMLGRGGGEGDIVLYLYVRMIKAKALLFFINRDTAVDLHDVWSLKLRS